MTCNGCLDAVKRSLNKNLGPDKIKSIEGDLNEQVLYALLIVTTMTEMQLCDSNDISFHSNSFDETNPPFCIVHQVRESQYGNECVTIERQLDGCLLSFFPYYIPSRRNVEWNGMSISLGTVMLPLCLSGRQTNTMPR